MHFSQTAEYALRAMVCLALKPHTDWVRSKDLAVATNIPEHYLSKLMRKLVVGGLVSSRKGHHGGFQLAMPAKHLRFLDVLTAVGESRDLQRCAFGWEVCNADCPCPLHEPMSTLRDQFFDWAASTTLASIAEHFRDSEGSTPP